MQPNNAMKFAGCDIKAWILLENNINEVSPLIAFCTNAQYDFFQVMQLQL